MKRVRITEMLVNKSTRERSRPVGPFLQTIYTFTSAKIVTHGKLACSTRDKISAKNHCFRRIVVWWHHRPIFFENDDGLTVTVNSESYRALLTDRMLKTWFSFASIVRPIFGGFDIIEIFSLVKDNYYADNSKTIRDRNVSKESKWHSKIDIINWTITKSAVMNN